MIVDHDVVNEEKEGALKCVCIYTSDPFSNADLSVSLPDRPLQSPVFIPFGISYIATSLKNAGHKVRLVVFGNQRRSFDKLRTELDWHKPGLVCLTAVSSKYHFVRNLARIIRRRCPNAYILIGGPHATLNPESVIGENCFDAICIGEGEEAVVLLALRLANGKDPSAINNLWVKSGKRIQKNPQNPFLVNLDALPHIDRAMWDEWIEDKTLHGPSVLVGRGCPNRCTYCSNHALAKKGKGKWVRVRSPEDIVNELETVVKHYPGLSSVYLEVEDLSTNLEYALTLCSRLETFNANRDKPIGFGANLCVRKRTIVDERLFRSMKRAGFNYINVGLESGSERIRNEVLRRPRYSNDDFIQFCDLAIKYGIEVNVYVLIGLPEETRVDLKATVDCLKRSNHSNLMPSIFYPYPGTDLYQKIKEQGLIKNSGLFDANQERYRARIDYPGLSRKRIQWTLITLFFRVYSGKWSLRRRLYMCIFSTLYVYPRLRFLNRILLRNRIGNEKG
ncbi:MAG: B12-binding domain-containing radical SAM protein [Desulfobacteraceae bacterium]|nr:B12-binding domain-containing radical SAM protein [Desulfobacteraceae bacterium]